MACHLMKSTNASCGCTLRDRRRYGTQQKVHKTCTHPTLFLISVGVSDTKMALLVSDALILPLSPCRRVEWCRRWEPATQ